MLEGTLGCPNCRDGFPIREGFGDLRAPPRHELPPGWAGGPGPVEEEATQRLVALLGVQEGPGTLVLLGREARYASAVAESIEGVEMVGVDAGLIGWTEQPRVSRIAAAPRLPFFSRCIRGVAVDGALGRRWIMESARVVARLGRVLVNHAPEDTTDVLEQAGLDVLAAEAGSVVAARS